MNRRWMKPYFLTLFPHVSNCGTTAGSLRKHPFLLALRRWGRYTAGPEYKIRTNKTIKKQQQQITSTQQRDVWIWVISRTKINDTAYHQVHWSKSKKHFLCQLKRPHSNSTKLHCKIPSWARTKLTPGKRQLSEFRGLFPYFNALRN